MDILVCNMALLHFSAKLASHWGSLAILLSCPANLVLSLLRSPCAFFSFPKGLYSASIRCLAADVAAEILSPRDNGEINFSGFFSTTL